VRVLKKLMPKTPFQMLLRGQNLVAYRNHPDDLVEAFVEKSGEVGIDIFRCFDAVNDERNFETAFKVIKKMRKHIQGTICYSLTERRVGGPVYNLSYYLEKGKIQEEMGARTVEASSGGGMVTVTANGKQQILEQLTYERAQERADQLADN
jgi:pyruvate carboxylase subunit B